MKKLRLFLILLSVLLVIFACQTPQSSSGGGNDDDNDDDDDGGSSSYTISGTLTCNESGISGKKAYLKLVAQYAPYDTYPLYWTIITFQGNSVNYSQSGITSGNYTGYIFIDINGSVIDDSPSSLPDDGDLYVFTDIEITSNTTLNVEDDDWDVF